MSATPTAPWRSRITGSGILKVADAVANPLNFRLHPAAQSQALAASLDNVGWVQQVVVNTTTGNLLDGHLRVELARQRGESELPCLFVELSAEEERLVLASLDPIAAMAGADRAKLQELLTSIQSEDEQVRGLLEQVARQQHIELSTAGGLVDPDEVPKAPEQPVTKPNDLWIVGNHRLLAGDSTNPEDVRRLMAAERAVAMICDPPYLTNYRADNHPQSYANRPATKDKHWDDYVDHDSSVAFYESFLRAALDDALWERPVVYQWFGTMRAPIVFEAWRRVRLLSHWVVVWHKSRPVLGRVDFLLDYECAMYGWIKGQRPARERRPPANATGVWEISCAIEDGRPEHPCCKPVATVSRPITWHTKPGELIYEPFSGSGTAIIAAEQTGRRCFAIELAPAFVDVAVLRWQRYSGKEATLAGDGRTFSEVAAERRPAPDGKHRGGGREQP
jgi:DNA modification methylase